MTALDVRNVVYAGYLAQDNFGDEISDRYFLDLIGAMLPSAGIAFLNLGFGTCGGIGLDEWYRRHMFGRNRLLAPAWFDFDFRRLSRAKDVFFLSNSGVPAEILYGCVRQARRNADMLTIGAQLKSVPDPPDDIAGNFDIVNFRDPMVRQLYGRRFRLPENARMFDPVADWFLHHRQHAPAVAATVDVMFAIIDGLDHDIQARSIERFLESSPLQTFALFASARADARAVECNAALRKLLSHPRNRNHAGDACLGSCHEVGLDRKVAALRSCDRMVSFGRLHAALVAALDGKWLAVSLPVTAAASVEPWFHDKIMFKSGIFPWLGLDIQLMEEDGTVVPIKFARADIDAYCKQTLAEAESFRSAMAAALRATSASPATDGGVGIQNRAGFQGTLRCLKTLDGASVDELTIVQHFCAVLDEARLAATHAANVDTEEAGTSLTADVAFSRFSDTVSLLSHLAEQRGLASRPWEGEAKEHAGYALARLAGVARPPMFAGAPPVAGAFQRGTRHFNAMLHEATCNLAATVERALALLGKP